MSKSKTRKTTAQFIQQAQAIHGNKYGYDKTIYSHHRTKLIIFCDKHGYFEQRPDTHLAGKGCKPCSIRERYLTTEEFIIRSNNIHNNLYDYSETQYTHSNNKVKIICKIHGMFSQPAHHHLEGAGCQECGKQKTASDIELFLKNSKLYHISRKPIIIDNFIKNAQRIHNNKYDYSYVEYTYFDVKVKIICKRHGVFLQTPGSHIQGGGCPNCSRDAQRLTLEEFIERANIIHNNKYDYSCVEYKNNQTKVCIICPKHGEFLQQPSNHLLGNKCPRCAHRISKNECNWLNSLDLPNDKEHRQVRILNKVVDGFDPKTNTIYEYYGDYWHGNINIYDGNAIHPETQLTFQKMYNETLIKENAFKQAGYKIITIWENDYLISINKKPHKISKKLCKHS